MTTVSAARLFARDEPLFVESDTGRLPKFPASRTARWGLRLVIAAAYAMLALWWNAASGGDWSGTANGDMVDRLAAIDWTSNADVVARLSPPLSSLIALLIPGGALGLSIASCVVAGFTVQFVLQSMRRRRFPPASRIVFGLTLATTPLYTYLVVTSFEASLGFLFFGLGMVDLVRFVTFANTQAGFRAGILFALAAFSDSTTTFAALVAALGGALIVHSRPGARLANAVVVAFPTISVFAALALLGIAFGAGPLSMVRGDVQWHSERVTAFFANFQHAGGWLYIAPVIVVAVTCIALKFPLTGLIAPLLAASTVLAHVVGLTPPGVAGVAYVLLLLLAVAIVPTTSTNSGTALTIATSVLLWLIGWASALAWPTVSGWMAVFGGANG